MKALQKLYKSLLSPRLTIIIFSIVTLFITVAALTETSLPQGPMLMDAYSIYSSPYFIWLSMVLLLITALCTLHQIRLNYQRWHRGASSWWRKVRLIGSPVFHLGLCLIILGAVFDVFGGMTGRIVLRPGESFVDLADRYFFLETKPLYLGGFEDFDLTLKDIELTYHADGIGTRGVFDLKTETHQQKVFLDRDTKQKVGLKTLARRGYGFYINYTINSMSGQNIHYSLGLDTKRNEQMDVYQREDFSQPQTDLSLSMEYLPNADLENHFDQTKNYEPKNPVILLKVENSSEELYNGIAKIDIPVTLKDGSTFTFYGIVPYIMVEVKWMLGTAIVTIGFILFLLGLSMYYMEQLGAGTKDWLEERVEVDV